MLRTIKKNKLINKIGRNVFRTLHKGFNAFENKLVKRWDIAGTVDLNLKGKSFKLFSDCDDHCVRELYYGFDWEKDELNVWTTLAEKSEVVFDIGANTGIYSVITSKFNPQAKIYAFEPNPANHKRLEKNIEINNVQNFSVIKKAVGNENSVIKFTVPKDDNISLVSSAVKEFSESFFNIEYKEIEVPQITIDDFVESEKIEKIDLIKLDFAPYNPEKKIYLKTKHMLKEIESKK